MHQRLTHVQDSKTKLLFSLTLVSLNFMMRSILFIFICLSFNQILMSICIHEIGSPTIRQRTSDTDATTLQKGKSVANIPQIDLSDEISKDEYGYTERIQGISKGTFITRINNFISILCISIFK